MPRGVRMSYRPYQQIERRRSRQISVGKVKVGGDAPITVQTMTNTLTSDAPATIAQIRKAELAGVDIVRVSCPDVESTAALKEIVAEVNVPVVADIHFHYKRAIEAAQAGAACLRINPGNIGSAERVREVVKAARDHGCSMRIGVNAGSLERHLLEKYGEPNPDALVESALEHAKILQDHDFHEFKISVKASDVFLAVAAYTQLAEVCDHPLHIGITEAGGKRAGTVKSAIGLGNLLWAGIGDTLRVSLSAEPEEEVHVGWDLLKSLGLRHRGVKIISCPSCARQGFDVIRTVATLEERLAHIETPLTLSIIGCVVNGPGEALMTDIGVTGGGGGRHMVYSAGKQDHTIQGDAMIEHVIEQVETRSPPSRRARRWRRPSATPRPHAPPTWCAPPWRRRSSGRRALPFSRKKGSKRFFFEKKKQKTVARPARNVIHVRIFGNKVFLLLFLQKKKTLPCLAPFTTSPRAGRRPGPSPLRIGAPSCPPHSRPAARATCSARRCAATRTWWRPRDAWPAPSAWTSGRRRCSRTRASSPARWATRRTWSPRRCTPFPTAAATA